MEQGLKAEQNDRWYLLDSIRGICILGMIIYHTLFDIVAFFGVTPDPAVADIINIIRDFGACCFICLSGICIHFGKKPLKRIGMLFCAGLVVSLVTFIVLPEMPIYFGILTFMGIAGLIMLPLKKILDKLPPIPFAVISFLLFLLTFEVSHGYLGYYDLVVYVLPETLYKNMLTAFFGFPYVGFASSDYYPLFPWIFMFFFGFFLWKLMKRSERLLRILRFRIKFTEKIGRLSLYIYIAHQPLIMGVLLLISYIVYHTS
ncbi:MAG: DUF1624 domain-containing protein [Clostridia bacterium]|nr:DUF1624 domain-containing protein [Clostridia bacterium]